MDARRCTIAANAAAHHGVFTRAERLSAGLTERQLQRDLQGNDLMRLGPGTFALAGTPSSWNQRLYGALAEFTHPRADALAGGVTAGKLLGLDGFRSDDIEVSVARIARHRASSLPFVVRSHGRLVAADKCTVSGFPCLSASRLLLEEAGRWTSSELESALDSSLRLGWTSETYIRRRLGELRCPGKRGVRLLDRVINGSGGHNWLEREFLTVAAQAGLPTPRTQVTFRRDGSFVARVDALWAEIMLVVEVAGHATHSMRRQRQRDAQRQSELMLLGYRVITFTYEDVTERPGWMVGILRQLVGQVAA